MIVKKRIKINTKKKSKIEVNNKDINDIWDSFKNFDQNSCNLINENTNNKNNIQNEEYSILFDYKCIDCETFTLIQQDGHSVCTVCGLQQNKKLSHCAEYRFYGDNDNKINNPERVGMVANYLLPQSSLGTMIKKRSSDSIQIKRMVQYNSWHQMPYKERSLYKICCKISNQCKINGIASIIIDRSKEFYNIIKDVNISRGDNRKGLIAACVFFACKDCNVPRSSKEIAKVFNISLSDMTKGIKNFRTNWFLSDNKNDSLTIEASNPIDYIDRYCSSIPVSNNIKYLSQFIVIKAVQYNYVNDNTAPSIAAGAIYIACELTNQKISKKQVSEACKTSEVTISKCFKKLSDNVVNLFPKSILKKYNIS